MSKNKSDNILIICANREIAEIANAGITAENIVVCWPLTRLFGVDNTRFAKCILSQHALDSMDKVKWYNDAIKPLLTPDCEIVRS